MPFEISIVKPGPDGCLRREQTRRVKLSGPAGPLARHVLGMQPSEEAAWSLPGKELARQLAPAGEEAGSWGLFLASEGNALIHVEALLGRTGDFETEILLRGACLIEAGEALWKKSGREVAEALLLRGGRLTPAGSWAWAPPKMAIGGAILTPGGLA